MQTYRTRMEVLLGCFWRRWTWMRTRSSRTLADIRLKTFADGLCHCNGFSTRSGADGNQLMSSTQVQSARAAKCMSLPTLQANADPYCNWA